MFRWSSLIGSALLAIIIVSCDSASEPVIREEVGVIHFYGDSSDVVLAPDSARVGTDFTVTVRTFGNGCVSAARTGVRYTGDAAVVTPYDSQATHVPAGWACTDILLRPVHTTVLRFPSNGYAQIRVEGRRKPDGASAVLTRTIKIIE